MDEYFFTWAMERLTSTQFCVYMACKFIGEDATTTMNAIGQMCGGLDETTVQMHVKALKKQQFVQCETTGGCTSIFWVRKSIEDKPLSEKIIRLRAGVKLVSPDRKIHLVPARGLTRFCRENGLQVASIYKMKQDATRTHKGWKLA